MEPPQRVRMDKWLWAVRLFKTRTQATSACNAGHVKIDGQSVKPSRDVRVGEIVSAHTGRMVRTVRVVGLLEQRVSGKVAQDHAEELTPPEEFERAKRECANGGPKFPRGWGRPTKKDRRRLEAFLPERSE